MLFICYSDLVRTADASIVVTVPPTSIQQDGNICGVMAVAFATDLLQGIDPSLRDYDQYVLRKHLQTCLENKSFSSFPSSQAIQDLNRKKQFEFNVYCHCRMPFFKSSLVDSKNSMAECDSCKQWYHRGCVQIPASLFDPQLSLYGLWKCPSCS